MHEAQVGLGVLGQITFGEVVLHQRLQTRA
jgi:hypothetical protein